MFVGGDSYLRLLEWRHKYQPDVNTEDLSDWTSGRISFPEQNHLYWKQIFPVMLLLKNWMLAPKICVTRPRENLFWYLRCITFGETNTSNALHLRNDVNLEVAATSLHLSRHGRAPIGKRCSNTKNGTVVRKTFVKKHPLHLHVSPLTVRWERPLKAAKNQVLTMWIGIWPGISAEKAIRLGQ